MNEVSHIVIADDHPLFRSALRQIIEARFKHARIVEAGALDDVIKAIETGEETDLLLLDLKMPGARGFSGLMYLRAQYPALPICIVSATDDRDTVRNALALGASGFVPKSSTTEQIGGAIATITEGGQWLPADTDISSASDEMADLIARLKTLTPQQVRVLMMLGEGLLNKQIAYEFGVSEATIKAHVSAVLQKLKVENRTKAVVAAARIEAGQWQLGAD